MPPNPQLPWLAPGAAFPSAHTAWGAASNAPGLLAAGGDLEVSTLERAYRSGIFPWFSAGDPVLWWSPNPRMVLPTAQFRLHRSLRKTLLRFLDSAHCELRIDSDFAAVIHACAHTPRSGQPGTWILPEMVQAYTRLHQQRLAHSVEVWVRGALVGGLYCVALGRAVFGESMFCTHTDASKIALAALVALCRAQGVGWIDCQQNTRHLASLGAGPIDRADFLAHVHEASAQPPIRWQMTGQYWQNLFGASAAESAPEPATEPAPVPPPVPAQPQPPTPPFAAP